MWEGNVEEFDLVGHRTAKICYAWLSVSEDDKTKIFTILKNRVINSATKAVQAAIFVDAQPSLHEPLRRRRFEQGCDESANIFLEPALFAQG